MRDKLPCYIVQDLLPLTAEHLTSQESEDAVREHLQVCADCREVYRQMTSFEPAAEADAREVDYLKKVKRGKRRVLLGALLAIAVVAAGMLFYFQSRPEKSAVSYDEASRTIVVYGKGDDTDLTLPDTGNEAQNLDAQYDSFHLRVYLPILRNEDTPLNTYLPAYLSRTNQSLAFLRSYLRENCSDQYPASRADKYVELSISAAEGYRWSEQEDRISLEIGDFYWHREELYVLSLLGSETVQWKQLGYAWYLGACVDPYCELLYLPFEPENAAYYDAYLRGGGGAEMTPENYRILTDAVAYRCLTEGMYWGTPYESMPLRNTALYSGPARINDPGDRMSVCMATSFIAYLADAYGFEQVSAFCFSQRSFTAAFGTDYQTAYDAWAAWILATYGEDA